MQEETKRQKQVGKLLQTELSDIFQRAGMSMAGGGMVSVSKVSMTPDLMEARVLLSFFQVKDPAALLKEFRSRTAEWRGELGNRVRNQLRRVPELQYFEDDTLDHVFKMEAIFQQINKEREAQKPADEQKPETGSAE